MDLIQRSPLSHSSLYRFGILIESVLHVFLYLSCAGDKKVQDDVLDRLLRRFAKAFRAFAPFFLRDHEKKLLTEMWIGPPQSFVRPVPFVDRVWQTEAGLRDRATQCLA